MREARRKIMFMWILAVFFAFLVLVRKVTLLVSVNEYRQTQVKQQEDCQIIDTLRFTYLFF